MTRSGSDIRDFYGAWGVPHPLIEAFSSRGYVTLTDIKQIADGLITRASKDGGLIPLSCEDGEDMHLLPRGAWHWQSLTAALVETKTRALMSMLPPLWQAEPATFDAARAARVPLFVLDENNFAVAARAIDTAGIDALLARPSTVAAFLHDLAEHGDRAPSTLVVACSPDENAQSLSCPASTRVFLELHIFPGMPLFVQCQNLSDGVDRRFHLADDFTIAQSGADFLVSVKDHTLLPVYRFAPGFSVERTGSCACGKDVFAL